MGSLERKFRREQAKEVCKELGISPGKKYSKKGEFDGLTGIQIAERKMKEREENDKNTKEK